MIAERLLIVIVVGLGIWGACLFLKQVQLWQMGRVTAVVYTPTLLYFGSKSCAVCPAQWRYVEQLKEAWNGRLAIESIDAEQEPDRAAQYHILTLPTTIIVDKSGVVREINYGLTPMQKLKKQLEIISGQ